MPKCDCRNINEVVTELSESFINGNISTVREEILSYKKEQAIALALLIYIELPQDSKDSFRDSVLVII